jgi:S-DNA-T family DNA segregation ATPase FtsK/SpoIIIE
MSPEQSSNPNKDGPSLQAPRHQPRWLMAVLCFVFCLLTAVALIDYGPEQSSHMTSNPTGKNLVGWMGSEFSYWTYYLLGYSAAFFPVFLAWMTYLALRPVRRFATTRNVAMLVAIFCFSSLAEMASDWIMITRSFPQGPGGLLGKLLYENILKDFMGVFGAGLMLAVLYTLCLMFVFTRDIGAEFDKILLFLHEWKEKRAQLAAEKAEQKKLLREQAIREKSEAKAAGVAAAAALLSKDKPEKKTDEVTPVPAPPPPIGPSGKKLSLPKIQDDPLAAKPGLRAMEKEKPELAATADKAEAAALGSATSEKAPKNKVGQTATDTKDLAVQAAGKIELNIVKPEELKKARIVLPQSEDANYQFPTLNLLKEQVKPSPENSEEEHRRNAENLLRILSEFGVEVSLGEIHVGPVITRYEVAPAPGVRVEKISGLDKNIALGMRAQSVRILAPIPGKAAVGVEVPNLHPTPVGLREILESEDWVNSKAEIPIALGKDVSGKPLISDLTKMPHLLIAGATGSGKSVCINAIVASILFSKSPKDLRMLMVDPKVVELKIFNTLPHMLIPVVTEPKKVPGALKWLLKEMEQRYQIFAKCNVRNIVGFNNRKKNPKHEFPTVPEATQATLDGVDPLDQVEVPERLPYIVAVIDELADLMMVAPAEIETAIARLAQLARAAGIHLIIATQRPSVNVITGVIKANLPSRIAFQVASQVDSRTIIDTKGADTLIGRGDMLFTPPGTSRLVRAQGAYVSDEEISGVVEFLQRNGPPIYAPEVQAQIDRSSKEDDDDEGGDDDLGDDDELYNEALEVLKSTRRASTSMLQRRLRIGYNRAARIMEIMEDKGIVGPENGSSPREILVDLDSL